MLRPTDVMSLIKKGNINRRMIVIRVTDVGAVSMEDGESRDLLVTHFQFGDLRDEDKRNLTGTVDDERDDVYHFIHGKLHAVATPDIMHVYRQDTKHKFDDDGGYRLICTIPGNAIQIFVRHMNRSRRPH